MQSDFHYYATYVAAYIAGYTHEDSLKIAYSAQYVDCCSATLLKKLKGPKSAVTTQMQSELMNVRTDIVGLQNVTRIWASFHFLPYDLYASIPKRPLRYLMKYRLICNSNGSLVADTVNLARDNSLQAVGVAMHVLADTWAHKYFVGTPSLVMNNTNSYFYEHVITDNGTEKRQIVFKHNPAVADDVNKNYFSGSIFQNDENSIMNLGHGRAGHLPDYSFIRYEYLPAWGNYEAVIKDNPAEYYKAFSQMVYALKCIKSGDEFVLDTYDTESVNQYSEEIKQILEKRQVNACDDWKKLGERISGCEVKDFVIDAYEQEYIHSGNDDKDDTFLGRFFIAAMAHKSMITGKIFKSGNILAGFSVDYKQLGFKGIKDYQKIIKKMRGSGNNG